MTDRQRNAIGILASIALTLVVLSCRSCSGGEVRHARRMTKVTTLRPIRAKGHAAAGYPFLQTTANVTRIGVNLSGLFNPIAWFF